MNIEKIGDLLLIGIGLALLVLFIIIGITGIYHVQEPSHAVFWIEVVLFLTCIVIGIDRLRKDW